MLYFMYVSAFFCNSNVFHVCFQNKTKKDSEHTTWGAQSIHLKVYKIHMCYTPGHQAQVNVTGGGGGVYHLYMCGMWYTREDTTQNM